MAKVSDIIERARRRARLQPAEEPMQAHEAEQARQTLNDMLFAWVADGTIASHAEFATLADDAVINATDNIVLTDDGNEALVACLAVRLCDEYGIQLSPAIAAHCDLGKRALSAKKFLDPDAPVVASQDAAMLIMPSQRREYF